MENPQSQYIEFLLNLERKIPQFKQLSATKQRVAFHLQQIKLVSIKIPETYPSPDEHVFLTDRGKTMIQILAQTFLNESSV